MKYKPSDINNLTDIKDLYEKQLLKYQAKLSQILTSSEEDTFTQISKYSQILEDIDNLAKCIFQLKKTKDSIAHNLNNF